MFNKENWLSESDALRELKQDGFDTAFVSEHNFYTINDAINNISNDELNPSVTIVRQTPYHARIYRNTASGIENSPLWTVCQIYVKG